MGAAGWVSLGCVAVVAVAAVLLVGEARVRAVLRAAQAADLPVILPRVLPGRIDYPTRAAMREEQALFAQIAAACREETSR